MRKINITKDTTSDDFKKLLTRTELSNITDLYVRLQSDTELNSLFKNDYLSDERLDKWFVQELFRNEPKMSFEFPIEEPDFADLVANINRGYCSVV